MDCRFTRLCPICSGTHHVLTCSSRLPGATPQSTTSNLVADIETAEPLQSFLNFRESNAVILQTASVIAASGTESGPIRILLDSGSQRSYCTRDLADRLDAKFIRNEKLSHSTFGGKTSLPGSFRVVEIEIKSRHSSAHTTTECVVVDTITRSVFTSINKASIHHHAHLQNLQLADEPDSQQPITMLIGLDHYWSIVGSEMRKGAKQAPVAITSIFGWIISGNVPSSHLNNTHSFLTQSVSTPRKPSSLDKLLRQFWELESLGIAEEELNTNDEYALQQFDDKVQFINGRYKVGLIWKPFHPALQSNRVSAEKRQSRVAKRLEANPSLQLEYEKAIQEFIDCEYVEEAHSPCTRGEFYMPHRPQEKVSSTTYKVRPVFDASAKDGNGNSLNDCLLTGPSLIPDVLDVMLRWRQWPVAFVSDLRRAFLQIEVDDCDRDFLRFLWNGKVYRFQRVPFGVNCSPFLLNATIRHHLQLDKDSGQYDPTLVTEIDQAMYVDDYVSGAQDSNAAAEKAIISNKILSDAGMTLRGWTSNSSELSRVLEGAGCDVLTVNEGIRVLGTEWSSSDQLYVRSVLWCANNAITKRELARYIPQAYDVLGILSPIVIRGKILLQRLWQANIGWDDANLSPQLLAEAEVVKSEFQKFEEITIPRYYFSEGSVDESVTLHVFCDASKDAYAACVYISSGDSSSLVIAKSRVAPISTKEIPRLEILGCLLGARLICRVRDQMAATVSHADLCCWTDSTVALSWIISEGAENDKRPVWINNRTKEICTLTKGMKWNHVRTHENPADLATRPVLTVDELKMSQLWWKGPAFILQPNDSWPEPPTSLAAKLQATNLGSPAASDEIDDDICLLTTSSTKPTKATNSTRPEEQHPQVVEPSPDHDAIFELKRCSRYSKVIRITAYALRFTSRMKQRIDTNHPEPEELLPVGQGYLKTKSGQVVSVPSKEERERAEIYWIKRIQVQHFKAEIEDLRLHAKVSSKSHYYALGPKLDSDGVLRSVGRAHRVQQRDPILLPKSSHLTRLLVAEIHENNFHVGVSQTLTEIQTRYWIVRGRQTVRHVLSTCLICKRHKVPPYQQIPSALPQWRLAEKRPFASSGIDFAGPFNVKEGKAYVLLITCCSTRALHLEVTPDQSTTSVINGIRRCRGRRGDIDFIASDNARSFLKARASFPGTEWITIPERAPWWGGFWERLVRSVKTALRHTIGRAGLNFEEFRTLMTEIEAVVNRRPLTYTSDDRDDPLPLRPVDFLLTPGPPPFATTQSPEVTLNSRLKHRKCLLEQAWRRWHREYLNEIHQWRLKEQGRLSPKVGDVVMIEPQQKFKNRALFPLGRITRLIVGTDGHCRAAYIMVNGHEVRRSTKHLYPLEISTGL